MSEFNERYQLIEYSMHLAVAGYSNQQIIDKLQECTSFDREHLKEIVDTAIDHVSSYDEASTYGAHSHEDFYE